MSVVSVRNVSKNFTVGKSAVAALTDVSFSVEAGEFLAVSGPSGSGKSTLLNIIGCIEKPDSGIVEIEGADVTERALNELAGLRSRKIGYIFQTFNLLPILTAAENVEYPLHLQRAPREARLERVTWALKEVGLEKFAGHKPRELSGGQRQRVAVARALVGKPAIVLADEPTANLDHATGTEILELMRGLNRKIGTTFIFSTHDPKVQAFAGRRLTLTDGRLTENPR